MTASSSSQSGCRSRPMACRLAADHSAACRRPSGVIVSRTRRLSCSSGSLRTIRSATIRVIRTDTRLLGSPVSRASSPTVTPGCPAISYSRARCGPDKGNPGPWPAPHAEGAGSAPPPGATPRPAPASRHGRTPRHPARPSRLLSQERSHQNNAAAAGQGGRDRLPRQTGPWPPRAPTAGQRSEIGRTAAVPTTRGPPPKPRAL